MKNSIRKRLPHRKRGESKVCKQRTIDAFQTGCDPGELKYFERYLLFRYTGFPKKRTPFWSLITASHFKIQTFTSNHSEKEVFHFSFDVLFRPFREKHRVKGCNKNVSLFLIVRSIDKRIVKIRLDYMIGMICCLFCICFCSGYYICNKNFHEKKKKYLAAC